MKKAKNKKVNRGGRPKLGGPKSKTVRIGLALPKSHHDRLKLLAKRSGVKLSEALRKIIAKAVA